MLISTYLVHAVAGFDSGDEEGAHAADRPTAVDPDQGEDRGAIGSRAVRMLAWGLHHFMFDPSCRVVDLMPVE